jgi:hypothetical protein
MCPAGNSWRKSEGTDAKHSRKRWTRIGGFGSIMVNGDGGDRARGTGCKGASAYGRAASIRRRPDRGLHRDASRRKPVDGQDRGQWFGGAEFQGPLARVREARAFLLIRPGKAIQPFFTNSRPGSRSSGKRYSPRPTIGQSGRTGRHTSFRSVSVLKRTVLSSI